MEDRNIWIKDGDENINIRRMKIKNLNVENKKKIWRMKRQGNENILKCEKEHKNKKDAESQKNQEEISSNKKKLTAFLAVPRDYGYDRVRSHDLQLT